MDYMQELESYLANLTGSMDACALAARQTCAALLQSLSNTEARCRQLVASQQAAGSSGVNVPDLGTCAAMINMARAQVCRMVMAYLQQLQGSCHSYLADAERQVAHGKEQLQVGISMQLSALDQEIKVWEKRQSTLAQRLRTVAAEKDEKLRQLEAERKRLQAKDASLKATADDDAAGWRHTREETPTTVLAALEKISEDELKALKTFKRESQRLASELAEAESASAPLQARRAQALAAQESARMQLNAQAGMVNALTRQSQQVMRYITDQERCRKIAADDALAHVAHVLPKLVQHANEAQQQLARCEKELRTSLYIAADNEAQELLAITRLYLLVTSVRVHRAQLVQRVCAQRRGERKGSIKKAVKFGGSADEVEAAAHAAEAEATAAAQAAADVAAAEEEEHQMIRQILQLSQACGLDVDSTLTHPGWLWSANGPAAIAPAFTQTNLGGAPYFPPTSAAVWGSLGVSPRANTQLHVPPPASTTHAVHVSSSVVSAAGPLQPQLQAQSHVAVAPACDVEPYDRYSPTYSVPAQATQPVAAQQGLPQQPHSIRLGQEGMSGLVTTRSAGQSMRPPPLVVPLPSTVDSTVSTEQHMPSTGTHPVGKPPRAHLSASSPTFDTRALTRDLTFGNQMERSKDDDRPSGGGRPAGALAGVPVAPTPAVSKEVECTEDLGMSVADEIRAAMSTFYPFQKEQGKRVGKTASDVANRVGEQADKNRHLGRPPSMSVPDLTQRASFTFIDPHGTPPASLSKPGSRESGYPPDREYHSEDLGQLSMRVPHIILNDLFDMRVCGNEKA